MALLYICTLCFYAHQCVLYIYGFLNMNECFCFVYYYHYYLVSQMLGDLLLYYVVVFFH